MTSQFEEIGRRLKANRMGRDLTADAIADELGISRAAVYRIETGGVVKMAWTGQPAGQGDGWRARTNPHGPLHPWSGGRN